GSDPPEISRHQPTVAEGLCRGLRIFPVAATHDRRSNAHLTDLALRQVAAIDIADSHFGAREGHADRAPIDFVAPLHPCRKGAAPHRGDRHWTFARAEDLGKPRAETDR